MSDQSEPSAEPERAQKVLARIGLGSRRASEILISEGRVTVNGKIIELGGRVGPEDELAVDGKVYSTRPDAITYLLNKPTGVVTTASDPDGRPTVVELVPDEPRVFPVGRLDLDTEGLLLLTNDGGLAHRLTHPSFGIEKEYLVEVRGKIARNSLRSLREGIELEDGMTSQAKASLLDSGLLRLTIHEGRNRQVRRMCEAIGHPVQRLVRSRIGPITDPKLKPGFSRRLSSDELLELQRAVETRR